MADFGKLNFSTSFKPTGAFPINANQYFESLSAAQAAAATAEEVGSTNTVYHYGMQLLVAENGSDTWYIIQRDKTLKPVGSGSGGGSFETDETLTLKDGVLSVNTADAVEQDNTLPVTSAAVHTTVGNIEILLQTI